jgi:hypothetical protein
MVALGALVGVAAGFTSAAFVTAELLVIGGLLALDRLELPRIDRWDRGATGEEAVGHVLDGLANAGWRVLHDVDLGRGNVDHILVGPAGVLTVETKSHGGRLRAERLDRRMLKQPYAQAKAVERITGGHVAPLLVFSQAFLDRPVSRVRGVTVLPARMLAAHLARRPSVLTDDEVAALNRRLAASVGEAPVAQPNSLSSSARCAPRPS